MQQNQKGTNVLTKRFKKRYTLNLCQAIGLFTAVYIICYKLAQHTTVSSFSIDSVWNRFMGWTHHFHVVAVALLPVYVALMVFGTAAFVIYLGSLVRRWLK